jgi:membrane-associated protease RseP (regulator of RpoE activity)
VAVPLQVNRATGIVTVDAMIDGRSYPVVLDSGGGYSWWRGDRVQQLAAANPDIVRAEGAPGESNQAMLDQPFEQQALVVRVPMMSIGGLQIRNAGLLGSGPLRGGLVSPMIGDLFWSAWEKGAGQPVAGWIGGNVLRDYDITIDYAKATSYWRAVAPARTDDLNSVGLSLVHSPNGYAVGALVTRNGVASVAGAEVGDRLVSIDEREVATMTRGAVIAALHGKPGEHRRLVLQRGDRSFDLDAVVVDY